MYKLTKNIVNILKNMAICSMSRDVCSGDVRDGVFMMDRCELVEELDK